MCERVNVCVCVPHPDVYESIACMYGSTCFYVRFRGSLALYVSPCVHTYQCLYAPECASVPVCLCVFECVCVHASMNMHELVMRLHGFLEGFMSPCR